ncbi:hypothetical protein RRG08_010798, partial [Elysia crispata]
RVSVSVDPPLIAVERNLDTRARNSSITGSLTLRLSRMCQLPELPAFFSKQ